MVLPPNLLNRHKYLRCKLKILARCCRLGRRYLKENADGVWDSSYDLFYRIIDTVSGTFVTEEVRLTDNFQSEYITWLFSDENAELILALKKFSEKRCST